MSLWSYGLALVGIVGIYLAGKKNLWGWAIGVFAQGLWIVFALVTGQYGFIISAVAYGFVYGKNFLDWRRKEQVMDLPNYHCPNCDDWDCYGCYCLDNPDCEECFRLSKLEEGM